MEAMAYTQSVKLVGLVVLFLAFCGVLFWAYGSKKRGAELEEYKNIPLHDDDDEEVKKDKFNG